MRRGEDGVWGSAGGASVVLPSQTALGSQAAPVENPMGRQHKQESTARTSSRGERHLLLMPEETVAGHSSKLVLGATSRTRQFLAGRRSVLPEPFPCAGASQG